MIVLGTTVTPEQMRNAAENIMRRLTGDETIVVVLSNLPDLQYYTCKNGKSALWEAEGMDKVASTMQMFFDGKYETYRVNFMDYVWEGKEKDNG